MQITRRRIDNRMEEKVLTGLIVSTNYSKQATQLISLEHFQAEHCRPVARWCLQYFRKYKVAPGRHIQDLYEQHKKRMTPEIISLTEDFLARLSSEYERAESFNAEYLLDQTINFVKERSLGILKDQIEVLLSEGKADEAEQATLEYRQIERRSLPVVDLFDSDTVDRLLSEEGRVGDELFSLPGAVGEMVGPLLRNTLVGVMGATGRGKSFIVQELGMVAATKGLNVLYFSLEMGERLLGMRFYRRLTGRVKPTFQKGETLLYPIFDCQGNQTNSCSLDRRRNTIKLKGTPTNISSFYSNARYVPCTACREEVRGDFDPGLWWYEKKVQKVDKVSIQQFLRGSEIHYGGLKGRLHILCQARLTLTQVENYMNCLEDDGFVTDVLIVDYPAIMASEFKSDDRRERLDDIWQRMKVLSGVKHCVVLAPTQSNRRGATRRSLAQIDVADNWGIPQHVDDLITINQLEGEKRSLVARMGMVKKREDEFDTGRECLVLQQLDVCSMILDSEWLNFSSTWAKRIRGREEEVE